MQSLWKKICQFLKKLNIELLYDPEILAPTELKTGIPMKTCTQQTIAAISTIAAESNPNVHQWMSGETKCAVCLQWFFLSYTKEWSTDLCYNRGTIKTSCQVKADRHLRPHRVWIHLYEVSRRRQSTWKVISSWHGLGRGEDGEQLPVGTGFPAKAVEAFWNETVVTAAQHCQKTGRHWIVKFAMVSGGGTQRWALGDGALSGSRIHSSAAWMRGLGGGLGCGSRAQGQCVWPGEQSKSEEGQHSGNAEQTRLRIAAGDWRIKRKGKRVFRKREGTQLHQKLMRLTRRHLVA